MKSFAVELQVGIGELHFGMTRDDVRKSLGEYSEFRKNEFCENTTDNFKFCHTFYSKENKLKAIEFFPKMEVNLILHGTELLGMEYGELLNYVKTLDSDVEIDADGFTSKKGISVYAPGDEIETVFLTAENYWD